MQQSPDRPRKKVASDKSELHPLSGGEELAGVGRITGARNEHVASLMKEAVARGKCAFCSPYFEEKNGESVIKLEGVPPKHWKVWLNPSPLSGTSHHIMLASNEHVLTEHELSDEANLERVRLTAAIQRLFGFASYTGFSRQGDPAFNSATVYHLHYHVVVSSGEPAASAIIPARYLRLITKTMPGLEEIADESGQDILDCVDTLRDALDTYREAQKGKAVPVRVKLSNKTGLNQVVRGS